MSEPETRLLLLRHGEVASHRGDVPVTESGLLHAERVGKILAARSVLPVAVLHGGTRRARQTAEAIIRGIDEPDRVVGAHHCFALRNPDCTSQAPGSTWSALRRRSPSRSPA